MVGDESLNEEYLSHHGILGQKWGVRRFQNPDGTLTKAGKERRKDSGISLYDQRKEVLRKKGLNDQAIEGQIKFENRAAIIAGVAAAAVGVGVTYALVQRHDLNSDFVLNAGSEMYRVASSDNTEMRDMFYAATNKLDAKKYAGLYSTQKQMQHPGSEIYQKVLSSNSDIKVAGANTGREIFNELKKDPKFTKDLYLRENTDYDTFNRYNIMIEKNTGATKKFFEELQRRGYGGIIDVNDSKYSGYNANKPVILFNQQGNVGIKEMKKLSGDDIAKNLKVGEGAIIAQQFINSTPVYMASIMGLSTFAISQVGEQYLEGEMNIKNLSVINKNNDSDSERSTGVRK